MAAKAPQGIEGVFGSATRARILGLLAQASAPRTGYSIAKELEIGVSNVYPELRRLEAMALVAARLDAKGSKVYTLADEDLRRFLQRRMRVMAASDWLAAERVAERETLSKDLGKLALRLPRKRAGRKDLAFDEEFRRLSQKDRALRLVKPNVTGVRRRRA